MIRYDRWMQMSNPWAVMRAAALSEGARQAAVSRIIDTMLELQLDYRHISPGWSSVSITALAGELPGGGGGHDQMLLASQRYSPDSEWHRACASLLRRLPPRQALAMLMQAARVRPGKGGCWWSKTAAQLVEHQDEAMQRLGIKGVAGFETVRSMQECAQAARNKLRTWLSEGSQEVAA